jgi:hypothetical protein
MMSKGNSVISDVVHAEESTLSENRGIMSVTSSATEVTVILPQPVNCVNVASKFHCVFVFVLLKLYNEI